MKPIFIEENEWKGEFFINEIYKSSDYTNLAPITQVQAVCVTEDGKIVLYKHIDGWYGLPGGKVEEGEDLYEALKREIYEETASELINAEVVAYVKSWKQKSPEKVTYNLRYYAKVRLLNEPVKDPAGKAMERILVDRDEAASKLNWGEKGKLLIDLALEKLK